MCCTNKNDITRKKGVTIVPKRATHTKGHQDVGFLGLRRIQPYRDSNFDSAPYMGSFQASCTCSLVVLAYETLKVLGLGLYRGPRVKICLGLCVSTSSAGCWVALESCCFPFRPCDPMKNQPDARRFPTFGVLVVGLSNKGNNLWRSKLESPHW